jgi:hypothetical protein
MENTNPAPTVETNVSDNASAQNTNSTPEATNSSFEDGGELKSGGGFSLVYYLTFALLISASAYSIFYYRQALNKLNDDDSDELKKQVLEVKNNLKKIMGNKYAVISK